ncbi:hypothetical protein QLH52_07020 [Methylomonas sp. OY6]|uniref:RiboL-PSP-HEPN domain-containing protein n=1 Tax=Methylomonas defluvii TaxID=3045149 RepID=A0ABU4UC30_9GAMM|nr:hypothetical protein [Methylomonas sp. OY6]MDX8127024.1 hypothetical protein [Methylomonas sp. OY6]
MSSPNGFLNMDIGYPGIEIKVELLVMQEYISQLEFGIKAVCNAYLDEELKKYEYSEYYEYRYIYDIAEEEFPKLIRLPLVVSIYTLFENSITQLLSYAQSKESKALNLRDLNGKSLVSKFNKYMKHVLEFDFQISDSSRDELNKLNKVRNCIVHANANLSSMPEDKAKEIRGLKAVGLDLSSSQINVSYDFLKISMDCVENVVCELMDFMENRYDFN